MFCKPETPVATGDLDLKILERAATELLDMRIQVAAGDYINLWIMNNMA